jgi:hypothetical protein
LKLTFSPSLCRLFGRSEVRLAYKEGASSALSDAPGISCSSIILSIECRVVVYGVVNALEVDVPIHVTPRLF